MRLARRLVEGTNNQFHHIAVLPLVTACDIIRFTRNAVFEYKVNCSCVITHIQPISAMFAIAIERNFFSLAYAVYNGRNKFFAVLARAVVVGAARDNDIELVRVVVRFCKNLRAGFRSSIWI